jgi:hypothetical protein
MNKYQSITLEANPFRGTPYHLIHNNHYADEDMSAISDSTLRYGHPDITGNQGGNSKSKNCGTDFFARTLY